MKKKPVILNRSVLAQSALFDIEGLHLRFSNGQERHFERIRGHGFGAVMIIPLLDEDTVLLVREYSAGMDEYVLGFPKGAIESDEDINADYSDFIGRREDSPLRRASEMGPVLVIRSFRWYARIYRESR